MLIEYKTTKHKREVDEATANHLVKAGIARHVYGTREMRVEPIHSAPVSDPKIKVSPRTGKPKRQYRRRDMQAQQ